MSIFNIKDDAFTNIVLNNVEDSVRDTGTFLTADIQAWFKEKLNLDVDNKYIENVILNSQRMFGQVVSMVITAFFTSMALQITTYLTGLFALLKIKDRTIGVFRRAAKIFGKNSARALLSGESLYTQEEVYNSTRRCNTFLFSPFPDRQIYAAPIIGTAVAVATAALPAIVGGDFDEARNSRELFEVLKGIPKTALDVTLDVQEGIAGSVLAMSTSGHNSITAIPKSDKAQQEIMQEIRQFFEELRNTRMMGG